MSTGHLDEWEPDYRWVKWLLAYVLFVVLCILL